MKMFFLVLTIIYALVGCSSMKTAGPHQSSTDFENHLMFVKAQDMEWKKIMPELGDNSPEIVILHVDPQTQATQLMIRVPKNFHVPKHWHKTNETHMILSGTFIMESEGKRAELGPNSYNYIPSKMIHEAWTNPDEGTLLFITVDGAWDINWVDGPPQSPQMR
jgi:mannose-6-phosphate isomerase-like protein (cupin superfamily)